MQGVYLIINNINNKKYIGCSKNIEKRWKEHKYLYDKIFIRYCEKKALYKAMRKYGIENFTFKILEETEDYFNKEKYWIQYYNTFLGDGYNETSGGEGNSCPKVKGGLNPNVELTKQEVFIIGNSMLNNFSSSDIFELFKDKISYNHFKKIWSGQENLWSDILLNEVKEYKESKEYIHKIKSEASLKRQIVKDNIERKKILKELLDKGYSRTPAYLYYIEHYEKDYSLNKFTHLWYDIKSPEDNKQLIYKIDINSGKILETYKTFAEAARKNNCDSSGISKVCKGHRQSCGGFKWEQK